MTESRVKKHWALITILLAVAIVAGGIVAWSKRDRNQPIEISLSSAREAQGKIHMGGAVVNPGFYPFGESDSIADIVQAAGGATGNADLGGLKLYVPETAEGYQPQKVDINRAEAWLLQALPGIGETLAQRIIEYRQRNGAFKNTNELVKVEGIGLATYERIKHLITVSD